LFINNSISNITATILTMAHGTGIWYHGSLTRRKYGKEKKKEKRRLKKK